MFRVKIIVTLRNLILDPQGKAVHHALESLQMQEIQNVRMGKYIEMEIDCATQGEAERITREACTKLLANPVMEDYSFSIEKL